MRGISEMFDSMRWENTIFRVLSRSNKWLQMQCLNNPCKFNQTPWFAKEFQKPKASSEVQHVQWGYLLTFYSQHFKEDVPLSTEQVSQAFTTLSLPMAPCWCGHTVFAHLVLIFQFFSILYSEQMKNCQNSISALCCL